MSDVVDLAIALRAMGALTLVLALVLALAWGLRRWGGGALALSGKGSRRLGIVEVLALDPRRRLVLVQRDGVEHLLLLGMTEEHVVERDIRPSILRPPTLPLPEQETL